MKRKRKNKPIVAGRKFAIFMVTRILPKTANRNGRRVVLVRCGSCGHEATKSTPELYEAKKLRPTSCGKCRWDVHRKMLPCRTCKKLVDRPSFVENRGGAVCDPCRLKGHTASEVARRVALLGRICRTCGCSDARRGFSLLNECVNCNRASFRNGRCRCGRAILRTRSCACGVPALTSSSNATRAARAAKWSAT